MPVIYPLKVLYSQSLSVICEYLFVSSFFIPGYPGSDDLYVLSFVRFSDFVLCSRLVSFVLSDTLCLPRAEIPTPSLCIQFIFAWELSCLSLWWNQPWIFYCDDYITYQLFVKVGFFFCRSSVCPGLLFCVFAIVLFLGSPVFSDSSTDFSSDLITKPRFETAYVLFLDDRLTRTVNKGLRLVVRIIDWSSTSCSARMIISFQWL